MENCTHTEKWTIKCQNRPTLTDTIDMMSAFSIPGHAEMSLHGFANGHAGVAEFFIKKELKAAVTPEDANAKV